VALSAQEVARKGPVNRRSETALIEKDLSFVSDDFNLEALPIIADRLLDACGRLQ
jgi:hypothetical protein